MSNSNGPAQPPRRRRPLWLTLLRVLAGIVGVVIVIAIAGIATLALYPVALNEGSKPAGHPAASYDAAVSAFAALRADDEGATLNERCRPVLLTHGQKAARVVVLFHGLTNCPAQYDELAPLLFAKGYNVLVARLPGHGYADTMTMALATVTAEDIAASADVWVDVAQGLGDKVDVIGLSTGGAMAAWAAQTRPDVDKAIAMAPFLAPKGLPNWAVHIVANALRVVPNQMVWWNPDDHVGQTNMNYAYPRFPTHIIGELMRFGQVIDDKAAATAPLSPHPEMLLNAAEPAISNPAAEQLTALWRGKGSTVEIKTLPANLALPHDIIDPRQLTANTAVVYPLIVEMLEDSGS